MSTINNIKKNIGDKSGFTRLVDFRLTKMMNIFAWKQKDLFQRRKFTTGFTLIEMMVAVSLFAIVVMISMTAILSVVDSNKKAQSMKVVMNNLNFALETMTRSIKTGTGLSLDSSTNTLSLKDQNGDWIRYSPGTNSDGGKGCIAKNDVCITAPEIDVTKLVFYGFDPINEHPSIVMVVGGTAKLNERISSDFNIQTTVTQRIPK